MTEGPVSRLRRYGVPVVAGFVMVVMTLLLAGCVQVNLDALGPSPTAATDTRTRAAPTVHSSRPTTAPVTTATTRALPPEPAIVAAYIPFPVARKAEMAAYSLRHYGVFSFSLDPSMIVLHYTAGPSWESAQAVFSADVVNQGELPGTCSHFVIDRDGTIYALVPVTIRCRHTIGLNDKAIGIEMVQPALADPFAADRAILDRPAQLASALALVRYLQATYKIPTTSVIGHAMANDDPHYRDLTGRRNDHVDWQTADVLTFRSLL